MRDNKFTKIILLFYLFCSHATALENSIGINIGEFAAFEVAKKIVGWNYDLYPLHLDANHIINDKWGVSFGGVYRYESYQKDLSGVVFGKGSLKELWTNYHEVFLMAGPRYSFSSSGLEGFYGAFKSGFSGGLSPAGFNVNFISQPEIGYSLLFGETIAFNLDLAGGVLLNMPLVEKPKFGFNTSLIGWLVHRTIPIIRMGVGIAF